MQFQTACLNTFRFTLVTFFLLFFCCVLSNVCKNYLQKWIHSHTGCICLVFPPECFFKWFLNELGQAVLKSHWLYMLIFSDRSVLLLGTFSLESWGFISTNTVSVLIKILFQTEQTIRMKASVKCESIKFDVQQRKEFCVRLRVS